MYKMTLFNKIISYGALASFILTMLWLLFFEGDFTIDTLSLTAKIIIAINILFFAGVFFLILTGWFMKKRK